MPADSFIEPQYFADFGHPENDQHPPSVVTLGEQLIADVYNCLRASKVWRKTLLLITYDEHGGCYDHVAPSAAVPPQPPVPGQTFGCALLGPLSWPRNWLARGSLLVADIGDVSQVPLAAKRNAEKMWALARSLLIWWRHPHFRNSLAYKAT